MFHLEDVLQLKDAEDVRLLVRRHPMTLVPGLFLAMVLLVVPFFFLFPLFGYGVVGIIIFSVAVFAGICIALRSLFMWDADVFILTTLRAVDVDQRGLLSRFVTETILETITDVRWERRGFLQTLLNVGTLTVQASNLEYPMVIKKIGRPLEVHELLNDLRHAQRPAQVHLSTEQRERLRVMQDVLASLSDEALGRIERQIAEERRQAALGSFLEKDRTA